MNEEKERMIRRFMDAVLLLKTPEECTRFFADLCTVKELRDLSQRLRVAAQLSAGHSYQAICRETGASTATISRVNRCLQYGSGGYREVLEKLKEESRQNEAG